MLKFLFVVDLTRFFYLAFGDNYVKTNEDTPMLSATKMFAIVSGDLRFMRIFAIRLSRDEASLNIGVVESDQLSMLLVALSSEPLTIRPKLS